MSTFIYMLRPRSPRLADETTPEEEASLGEHFEYLQRALEEGKPILAGPCADGAFGIVIFRATTEEEAEEFMLNDPAVSQGAMRAELHGYRISLMGNV